MAQWPLVKRPPGREACHGAMAALVRRQPLGFMTASVRKWPLPGTKAAQALSRPPLPRHMGAAPRVAEVFFGGEAIH